jgi:hypothetical protein
LLCYNRYSHLIQILNMFTCTGNLALLQWFQLRNDLRHAGVELGVAQRIRVTHSNM